MVPWMRLGPAPVWPGLVRADLVGVPAVLERSGDAPARATFEMVAAVTTEEAPESGLLPKPEVDAIEERQRDFVTARSPQQEVPYQAGSEPAIECLVRASRRWPATGPRRACPLLSAK